MTVNSADLNVDENDEQHATRNVIRAFLRNIAIAIQDRQYGLQPTRPAEYINKITDNCQNDKDANSYDEPRYSEQRNWETGSRDQVCQEVQNTMTDTRETTALLHNDKPGSSREDDEGTEGSGSSKTETFSDSQTARAASSSVDNELEEILLDGPETDSDPVTANTESDVIHELLVIEAEKDPDDIEEVKPLGRDDDINLSELGIDPRLTDEASEPVDDKAGGPLIAENDVDLDNERLNMSDQSRESVNDEEMNLKSRAGLEDSLIEQMNESMIREVDENKMDGDNVDRSAEADKTKKSEVIQIVGEVEQNSKSEESRTMEAAIARREIDIMSLEKSMKRLELLKQKYELELFIANCKMNLKSNKESGQEMSYKCPKDQKELKHFKYGRSNSTGRESNHDDVALPLANLKKNVQEHPLRFLDKVNRDQTLEESWPELTDENEEENKSSSESEFLNRYVSRFSKSTYICPSNAMRYITMYPLNNMNTRTHPSQVLGIPWENFERETMRKASFVFYPNSARQSASLLAAGGFVYIGEGESDKAMCFYCYAVKENWRADENIENVHRSLSPDCPMVVVIASNNVAAATTEGAVGDSVAPSQSPKQPSSSPIPDEERRRQRHQQHRQQRHRQSTNRISESALRESIHPLARTLLDPPAQPASSPSPQNDQTAQDTSQNHHPIINSQIYAIPPNPQTSNSSEGPTSANTSTAEDSTDSRSAQMPRQLNYRDLGIFHERPKHPQFAVLVTRLMTFDIWPRDHPLKPDDLAKSGLYYAGYADCCKCFFCGGGLRRWDPEDDAFVEHARWFPRCAYIRQYMGDAFIKAVGELKERGGTITHQQVIDYMEQKRMPMHNEFEDMPIRDDAAVRSLIDEGYQEEEVCKAAREIRQNGVPLSADVILEKLMGMTVSAPRESGATAGESGATGAAGRTQQDGIQELKDQNYTLRSNLTCKICMDKEVRMVFLPCGHLVACQECAVALQDCPVCRRHIRAVVRASIR